MQGQHQYQPELFSQIDYEQLIPPTHLLRKIDKVLDLSFLRDLTAPLYVNDKGRPSVDPEVFVRMILLEYLYNINSDRQLCEEIGYNLAYRWFCKLSLTDKVPDHSSLTRIRDRLGEKTYEDIFNRVVDQCRSKGLVNLKQIMMDGSIIKANASLYAMKERDEEKPEDKNDPLPPNGAVFSKDGFSNNDFRQRNVEGKKLSNKTHVNASDPEATLSGKAFEAKALAYKTHHTIDAESRVIVDCHVTTGIVSEVKTALDRVDAVQNRLQMRIEEIIADRGYGSGKNLESLSQKDIKTNIPLWSSKVGETFAKELAFGFKVDVENKNVFCPEGHEMKFSSDDRTGKRSLWTLKKSICSLCPRARECMTDHEYKHRSKRLAVPDHYELFERIRAQQENPEFRKKLWQRMWKMEGIFAEAKSFHGLRRARYRGRAKLQMQVYMISTVQNLKRMANSVLVDLTFIFEILKIWLFAAAKVPLLA